MRGRGGADVGRSRGSGRGVAPGIDGREARAFRMSRPRAAAPLTGVDTSQRSFVPARRAAPHGNCVAPLSQSPRTETARIRHVDQSAASAGRPRTELQLLPLRLPEPTGRTLARSGCHSHGFPELMNGSGKPGAEAPEQLLRANRLQGNTSQLGRPVRGHRAGPHECFPGRWMHWGARGAALHFSAY